MSSESVGFERCLNSFARNTLLGAVSGLVAGFVLFKRGRLASTMYGAGLGSGLSSNDCEFFYSRLRGTNGIDKIGN
jgi:hypothetical protein